MTSLTPFYQRDDVQETVVLAAFSVYGTDTRDAQHNLQGRLRPLLMSQDDRSPIECWWIAEDNRDDGSDNDSAVFVKPGAQTLASKLLMLAGLTWNHNVFDADNRFEAPSWDECLENLKAALLDAEREDAVDYVCAECGTSEAETYVVTTLDYDDPSTRTEVCMPCHEEIS